MEIINKYPVKVFKKEYNGKNLYRIGLNKKTPEGKYIYGYIDAQFRKGVDIDINKKIYIKDAWLDFYINKDNNTSVYIFVNNFEYVSDVIKDSKASGEPIENSGSIYTDDIEIEDNDLPF